MNTDHWKSLIWNCRIHGRSQSWHSSSLSFEMSHWNYSYCCSCTTHPSMTCSCCPGCWFHDWRRCEAWRTDQDVRKMCALGQGRSDKLEPIAAISEAWWKWNIDANESNESLCLVYATSKFLKVFLCCQNLCSQRNQIQKCHETQHNPGDTNPSLRGLLLSQFFVQIPDRPERSHLDQSSMVIPLDPIDPYWTFESPASPTSPMGFQEKTTPRPCSNLSAFWIELAGKRQTSSQHIVSKHSEKHEKTYMERYCKCRKLWRYLTPLQEFHWCFLLWQFCFNLHSLSYISSPLKVPTMGTAHLALLHQCLHDSQSAEKHCFTPSHKEFVNTLVVCLCTRLDRNWTHTFHKNHLSSGNFKDKAT